MLLGLLALALVDSINPSAIVVTLYLLSRGRVPAQVVVYVAAIFLTYLTLGMMMMSGIDALLPSLRTTSAAGSGSSCRASSGSPCCSTRSGRQRQPGRRRASSLARARIAALALLGVTVTAMELPTAVPYFGAIALLTTADLPMAQWLPLLVLYNAIFVLPPVLLLAGPRRFREAAGCALRRPQGAITGWCARDDALDLWSRGRRAARLERRGIPRPLRAAQLNRHTAESLVPSPQSLQVFQEPLERVVEDAGELANER